MFECDIAHCRSVAVLFLLYKISCNPMHPLIVIYLGRMCSMSRIDILIRFLAAEPRSTAGSLFSSQCPCGKILLTLYSMVWDWPISRAGSMFYFIFISCSIAFCLLLLSLSFFLSIGWYCGAGVLGLIGCRSLSVGLALPTSFNNYNNNNK